jgi:molybdenum cofactor guanylyltransferase
MLSASSGGTRAPVGVVLAGGAGRRLSPGGAAASSRVVMSKAAALLGGRPLVAYPLAVLAEVCDRLAVVCKRRTALPEVGFAERWEEPEEPLHPLAGIRHALERAQGPVLVCAADMPFVIPEVLRALLAAGNAPQRVAVVAATARGVEPLLALYRPAALPGLSHAPPGEPLRATVTRLDPVLVPVAESVARSVNTPADLAAAEAELGQRYPLRREPGIADRTPTGDEGAL